MPKNAYPTIKLSVLHMLIYKCNVIPVKRKKSNSFCFCFLKQGLELEELSSKVYMNKNQRTLSRKILKQKRNEQVVAHQILKCIKSLIIKAMWHQHREQWDRKEIQKQCQTIRIQQHFRTREKLLLAQLRNLENNNIVGSTTHTLCQDNIQIDQRCQSKKKEEKEEPL